MAKVGRGEGHKVVGAERQRNRGATGARPVVQTTISAQSAEYFRDHPEYAVGRCLDLCVDAQLEKDLTERLKRFELESAALEVGGCSCGRLLRPRETKVGPAGVCFGCNQSAASCGCRPTRELALRRIIDWQKIRTEAGLETGPEDFAAKRAELGLVPNADEDAALRRKEREVSARRSAEALEAGASWHDGPAIVRRKA